LQERKKIISTIIKVLIGLGSFFIIYWRLKSDLTSDKLDLLTDFILSSKGLICFSVCLLLIPLNWGIESYKW